MRENVIHIYGRRTIETLYEIISKLNVNTKSRIYLKAYGASINQVIRILQILENLVGVVVFKSEFSTEIIENSNVAVLEVPIKLKNSHKLKYSSSDKKNWISENFGHVNFVNYSTYQLLIDNYLSKGGQVEFTVRNSKEVFDILKVDQTETGLSYKISETDMSSTMKERLNKSLLRSGLKYSSKWQDSALKLSDKDDVIMGLDTNVIYNCTISEQILPTISLLNRRKFVNTPNWILLVVPSTVMYELESASNIRNEKGKLSYPGRQAYRALQEIMELSQNIDIPGVSLLITGETNPILDVNQALKKINKNLVQGQKNDNVGTGHYAYFKSSGEDMIIRQQYKQFLKDINFHKNTFFLTSDKSNAALSTAEGIDSLYLEISGLSQKSEGLMSGKSHVKMPVSVPIGSLIYELAVSFEGIFLKFGNHVIEFKCDTKGDYLGRWMRKQLRIEKSYLQELIQDYDGAFDLQKSYEIFDFISSNYENSKWSMNMENAFE